MPGDAGVMPSSGLPPFGPLGNRFTTIIAELKSLQQPAGSGVLPEAVQRCRRLGGWQMTAADSRSAPCKRREADWRRQHVGDARKDRKGKDGQRKAEDAHDASQARQLFWGQGRGAGARSGMCLRAACGVFSVSGHHASQHRTCPRTTRSSPAATSRR